MVQDNRILVPGKITKVVLRAVDGVLWKVILRYHVQLLLPMLSTNLILSILSISFTELSQYSFVWIFLSPPRSSSDVLLCLASSVEREL